MSEVNEAMVEAKAREALFNKEMARTHLVRPVNGACEYFYVSFAGARIAFGQGDDPNGWGNYDARMARLTKEASEQANAINKLMLQVAKDAVRAALAAQPDLPASIDDELELIAEHPDPVVRNVVKRIRAMGLGWDAVIEAGNTMANILRNPQPGTLPDPQGSLAALVWDQAIRALKQEQQS